MRTQTSSMTLKIPQHHSHPGDLVVGGGAVAVTIDSDHAADRIWPLGGDHVVGTWLRVRLFDRYEYLLIPVQSVL